MFKKSIGRLLAAAGLLLVLSGSILYAQPDKTTITLDIEDVPVGQVMKEIESQSRYLFINKGIDTGFPVTVKVKEKPVSAALEQMFAGTRIGYSFDGTYIIVSEKAADTPLTVTGVIKDQSGQPVPGAAIMVLGTSTGEVSDLDGKYSITIKEPSSDTVLEITLLGYDTERVMLNGRSKIDVTLRESNTLLDGVVVTALGIKREEKALSYNVQEVSSDIVNAVKDANFVNALSGKVAGLQINQSASGAGGSTRVIMRGVKSISGNNNALYVVDGIPMPSLRSSQTEGITENPDGGGGR